MRQLPAFCFLSLLSSIPADLSAQVISGRVVEFDSNRPVATAAISLIANERAILWTESDTGGSFRIGVPRAGLYRLRIERIGYAVAMSDKLEVRANENLEVSIRLSVTAVRIDSVLVVTDRRLIRQRSEFERRRETGRRSGLGVFITREALDSTSAQTVTALLTRVPLLGAGPVSLSRGGCTPTLYINGARFQLTRLESLDDLIQPTTLEGIEIYRNATEMPREFAGIDHCAAIVFWTRAGPAARGGTWRLLAAGGALLGLVVLFFTN